jgi:REDY-like protein HapK
MAKLFLHYTLKPGVSNETFEAWTRSTDYPQMRGLKRVASFTTHRVRGLLMGEGEIGIDYIEVFDIPDLDGFIAEDMGCAMMQALMVQFMGYVDNSRFMIADEVV